MLAAGQPAAAPDLRLPAELCVAGDRRRGPGRSTGGAAGAALPQRRRCQGCNAATRQGPRRQRPPKRRIVQQPGGGHLVMRLRQGLIGGADADREIPVPQPLCGGPAGGLVFGQAGLPGSPRKPRAGETVPPPGSAMHHRRWRRLHPCSYPKEGVCGRRHGSGRCAPACAPARVSQLGR